MRLLLDTHIFLWFISGDARLPAEWRESIRDADNEVYLSVVSLWEAVVKHRLGKLPLPYSPETYLPTQRARHQIASLSLDEASVRHLAIYSTRHSIRLFSSALWRAPAVPQPQRLFGTSESVRSVIASMHLGVSLMPFEYRSKWLVETIDYQGNTSSTDTAF
jgi:PIN domain nuclease of toxin-antitoxin system